MGDILFLSQRIPWPPDKGDKIRSWRALEYLAARRKVHLGTFIDDPDDWRHVPVMESLCETSHIAKLDPLKARLRSARGLLTGGPLSLPYFFDRGLKQWVETTLATRDISLIYVFSSAMAQYVQDLTGRRPVLVMDFVDVDSEKFRQYAREGGLLSKLVYGREGKALLAFDRKVAAMADHSLFVSEPEAKLFRDLAPEVSRKVKAMSNGIDTDYFSPDTVTGSRDDWPAYGTDLNLVFTGRMDYKPNIDAVLWFVREVLPKLTARHPDVRLAIAGAAPVPDVEALGADPAITVTGRVEDMRPWIAHADIAVAPMMIGRGIQNKVLEAAAMGRPVITTSEGLQGIDLVPGEHVVVADGTDAFAEAILALASDGGGEAMGQRARKALVDHYSWQARFAKLGDYLPD